VEPAEAVSIQIEGRSDQSTEPVPAPSDAREVRTDVPSACPTSPPGSEESSSAALSLPPGSFLARRSAGAPSTRLEAAIPIMVGVPEGFDVGHRTAFVLANVEGISSIATIAAQTDLPLGEVIAAVLELAAIGAVRLTEPSYPPPKVSGIFTR
jgi:hypothetical protein